MRMLKWAAMVLAVLGLAFGGLWYYKTRVATAAFSPEWDPTGQYIVFYEWLRDEGDRQTRMFKIMPDGSGKTQLGPDTPNFPSLPTVSADGKYALYSDLTNIYRYSIEDNTSLKLTDADGVRYFGPQFSPDGQTVVYDNMNSKGFIHLMDADGGNQRKLPVKGARPAFSPDGSHIVYHANVDGVDQLMLMTAQGQPLRQLTHSDGDNMDASFSPDGRFVLYMREMADGTIEAFELALAGGKERQVTHMGKKVWGIDYSPDGKQLVLAAEDFFGSHIYVMPHAGGEPVKLL